MSSNVKEMEYELHDIYFGKTKVWGSVLYPLSNCSTGVAKGLLGRVLLVG